MLIKVPIERLAPAMIGVIPASGKSVAERWRYASVAVPRSSAAASVELAGGLLVAQITNIVAFCGMSNVCAALLGEIIEQLCAKAEQNWLWHF